MGGEIGVESVVGEGSTFWFTSLLRGRPELAPPAVERESLHGVSALIVDDNATNRVILERQLAACGIASRAAADGDTALAILQQAAEGGTLPDVALFDVQMPRMDGLELASAVAADTRLDPVRVILLTSAVSSRLARCDRAVASLTKPVRQAELVETIATALAVRLRVVAPVAPAAPPTPAPRLRGRVLVAEDNLVNQKVATAMLKHLGYRVDVVADGREAVEAIERAGYAAVLMDCQMPEMNGYEASAEIRRREKPGHRVPIVAVTASAIKGDEDRCLAAGMDAYVTKPVTVEVLAAVLARLIDSPPEGAAAEVLDPATLDSLWELGGNSPAVLEELADLFIEGAPADIAMLNGAVAEVDLAAAARAAHRLKGSCAAVGATSMGRLAAQIEAAAMENRSDTVAARVATMDPLFEEVRTALRAAALEGASPAARG
jgi:CheY-like chemotaxis protein/HPt (histidine-containing phosphotransfer) domain-containing protein